jgi:hypothetical protein
VGNAEIEFDAVVGPAGGETAVDRRWVGTRQDPPEAAGVVDLEAVPAFQQANGRARGEGVVGELDAKVRVGVCVGHW